MPSIWPADLARRVGDRVHVSVGPALRHRVGDLRQGAAAGGVSDVGVGGGSVAYPVAVDVPALVVEAGEEYDDRAVGARRRAVDVRLRDAYAVLDLELELEFGLVVVELEAGLAAVSVSTPPAGVVTSWLPVSVALNFCPPFRRCQP